MKHKLVLFWTEMSKEIAEEHKKYALRITAPQWSNARTIHTFSSLDVFSERNIRIFGGKRNVSPNRVVRNGPKINA